MTKMSAEPLREKVEEQILEHWRGNIGYRDATTNILSLFTGELRNLQKSEWIEGMASKEIDSRISELEKGK